MLASLAPAVALVVTGHLSLILATFPPLVGIQNGCGKPSLPRWLYCAPKLEHMVLAAGAFGISGLIILVDVAASWAAREFGALSMHQQVAVAASSLIAAAQTFFAGVFLSTIAGSEPDLKFVRSALAATHVRMIDTGSQESCSKSTPRASGTSSSSTVDNVGVPAPTR